jgi:hypothetical protein
MFVVFADTTETAIRFLTQTLRLLTLVHHRPILARDVRACADSARSGNHLPNEKRNMKSQHRHELQTNELGKVADKVVGSMGGFLESYGNRILIGFCVAMVVASLVIYKVRRDRNQEAVAWRELSRARNAEDYATVSESHPGTIAGRWARVHEAESRLNEGVQLLFSNVESGTKELKLARERLQGLVDQKGAPPEIRERALFALGRCLEALSDGSETEAVKAYQALLREFPGTIYKKDADRRIDALNSGSGQEFYAWFAKYERPKVSEKRPRDRAGSRIGDEDLNLDESSLTLPEDIGNLPVESENSGGEEKEPATEAPAAEAEKKPAADTPSTPESKPEKPESDSKSP